MWSPVNVRSRVKVSMRQKDHLMEYGKEEEKHFNGLKGENCAASTEVDALGKIPKICLFSFMFEHLEVNFAKLYRIMIH